MKDEEVWNTAPSNDECAANKTWITENGCVLAAWHPQWGGYAGRCLVRFSKHNGCFDVMNWHDGDFDSDTPTELHYCSAEQLVDFGLLVLATNPSVTPGASWIDEAICKLQAMRPAQD